MSFKRVLLFSILTLVFLKPFAQVNLQTGSAVFSLPMFDWKDDKSRLSSVVALSYSSGNGLKVNEVASSVGQGWNLVAGGAIVRLQIGEPDDQQKRDGSNSQDISRYPSGYMYATMPVLNGCPVALTKYPIYKGMNTIYTQHNVTQEDKQLDYFSFQFNGKVGMFALDVVHGTGVSLGDTRMKITYQTDPSMTSQGIRTTITSFTIQDVDGLTYKFTKHGITKVLHADFCDQARTKPLTQPSFKGGNVYYQSAFENSKLTNPFIVGSWYLTEVDDVLANRKIMYNYDRTRSINNAAGDDISYNAEGDYVIISHKNSMTQTPVLTSISYPDGHLVTFNDGPDRVDLNGDKALGSVDITFKGRALSKYQLNTTYFIRNRYGNPISAEQKSASRLCLRSVKKIGIDLKEDMAPYQFDYYLGSSASDDFVPPPFFYAKDIWGFYNGANSVPFNNDLVHSSMPLASPSTAFQLSFTQLKGLCFLNAGVPASQVYLNPKAGYARNGLLKQIIYPTGGSLRYDYDQNSGSFEGSSTVTTLGGVHVSQTSSADGSRPNGCALPVTTQYHYVLPNNASSLWGMETPVNSTVKHSHYNSEEKKYHWKFSCFPFGCCYWNYQYPGILSEMEAVSLMDIQKFMNAIAPVLGILSVVSDVMDVLNLIFVSTGVLAWVAVIVDIVGGLVTLGITCFSGNNSKDNTFTTYYSADLNAGNPLPAQFKRVEIIENTGDIGKDVQGFTSKDDVAFWVDYGQNRDFSSKQRYPSWAYGLPLYDSTYDAGNHKIKAVKNFYGFTQQDCGSKPDTGGAAALSVSRGMQTLAVAQPNASACPLKIKHPLNLKNTKCQVLQTSSQNSKDWDDATKFNVSYTLSDITNVMTVDTFDLFSGRAELTSTVVTDFNRTDESRFVSTVTNFSYNSYYNYELNQKSTTESNGDVTTTNYTYTSDYTPYTTSTALQGLIQHNILNYPVSTYSTVGGQVLGEKVTTFVQQANGDILPGALLEQRFARPTSGVTLYKPTNPSNSTIYKQLKTYFYDLNANLIGNKDEGGRSLTSIYNYSDKYVVALAINADPILDKVAYTSFETDDADALGGWQISGSGGLTYASAAMTGNRSLTLNGRTLTGAVNSNKPNTLSFWATSGLAVSGGTMIKSAPTINGFTYYEYDVPQGTSFVIIGGNANIDEVRLYPKMARIKTTTYDPVLGKTSDCDENGRITYYEYDNMGRVRAIRDENHNIIQMREYNNVSAAHLTGCPGSFTNSLVSESFLKTNCATGYQGNEVSYSVPAGRYTSTISQEDADLKAEIDLLTNGPSNANTSASGSCTFIFKNDPKSMSFTTESCDPGQQGGTVTYSVPAGTYSSLISLADANQQALDDIAANGQAYANAPDTRSCSFDNTPDWNWTDGDPTTCYNVNGVAHTYYYAIDLNPNSSTYNTHSWLDGGPAAGGSCSVVNNVYVTMDYENTWVDMFGSDHGDVVVHFWNKSTFGSPAAQPLAVYNLTVNYGVQWEFDESQSFGSVTTTDNVTSLVLVSNTPLTAPDPNCFQTFPPSQICIQYAYSYFIAPGNYVID